MKQIINSYWKGVSISWCLESAKRMLDCNDPCSVHDCSECFLDSRNTGLIGNCAAMVSLLTNQESQMGLSTKDIISPIVEEFIKIAGDTNLIQMELYINKLKNNSNE